MELRHLRYFIAVAEEGSLTVAAEKRLHTSQPSLSRQIRDLEYEVGTSLFNRSVHGAELTAAGRAFLDHARLALAQVDAARDAARRAAKPDMKTFGIGFLTGHEVNWLPEITHILTRELPGTELKVSSQNSPELADALMTDHLDVAFMRAELHRPELSYISIATEPFIVALPSDHRLASKKEIEAKELEKEVFIGMDELAGPVTRIIEDYLDSQKLKIKPTHRVHGLAMAMSLIASTRGVSLLPLYAKNFLPWSVTSRPLKGAGPSIELVVGYKKTNTSPILETFLSRIEQIKNKKT